MDVIARIYPRSELVPAATTGNLHTSTVIRHRRRRGWGQREDSCGDVSAGMCQCKCHDARLCARFIERLRFHID